MRRLWGCILLAGMSQLAGAEPFAPSNLSARINPGPLVNLQWTDNSTNEDIFSVERRNADSGPFKLLVSMSKNQTKYADRAVPPTGPVWYRVRARNAQGYSAYSPEVRAVADLPPAAKKVTLNYDLVDLSAVARLSDPASVLGSYLGKGLAISLAMGTSYQSQAVTSIFASAWGGSGYTVNFWLSQSQFDALWAKSSSGAVPYTIRYEVIDGSTRTLVLAESGTFVLRQRPDNYTYSVGVVQVFPPGVNELNKMNVCLVQDASQGGQGYYPIGTVVPDCAAKWDWGSNAATITTRSIPAFDLLWGLADSTTLTNVTSIPNQKQARAGDISVYSLRYLGRYWEELLAKQGIQSTKRLGRNPKFRLTMLAPIVAENTLTSSDHAAVKDYFDRVLTERKMDMSSYDFVIYIQYYPNNYTGKEFSRSFAAGRRSYNSLQLSSENIVFNKLFMTVAHEMGHQLFSLPDRYDGFGIRLPDGVPDPTRFPQTSACIMTKLFGWKATSATQATGYSTASYVDEYAALGLGRFHTEDPKNFQLCPDDVSSIRE